MSFCQHGQTIVILQPSSPLSKVCATTRIIKYARSPSIKKLSENIFQLSYSFRLKRIVTYNPLTINQLISLFRSIPDIKHFRQKYYQHEQTKSEFPVVFRRLGKEPLFLCEKT